MALLGKTVIKPFDGTDSEDGNGFGFRQNTDSNEVLNTSFLYGPKENARDFPVSDPISTLIDTSTSRRNSSNNSIGHYINIQDEWIQIIGVQSKKFPDTWFGFYHSEFLIERDIFNTLDLSTYEGYAEGTEVRFYTELPEDVKEFYGIGASAEDESLETYSFEIEQTSNNFGVDGYQIEQTILNPFNPFKGMDIDINEFQNTNQGLENSNNDGRIELGMFSFDDDNLASDNFPNILAPPFIGINKRNLVNNGDCKFVKEALEVDDDGISVIVEPEGDWRFLSLKRTPPDSQFSDEQIPWSTWYTDGDAQGFIAYGGKLTYVPLSKNQITTETSYWGNITNGGINPANKISNLFSPGGNQSTINGDLNAGTIQTYWRDTYRIQSQTFQNQEVPHIAAWIVSDEAFSNSKCLCFMNFQIWDRAKLYGYLNPDEDEGYVFNYLLPDLRHNEGIVTENIDDSEFLPDHIDNQYRVLNQVQKIYDKFNDEPLNPYSSLKIRFKMKTTHVLPPANSFDDGEDAMDFQDNPLNNYAPKVEIGILQSQFEETPKTGLKGLPPLGWNEYFKAPGSWNSERYFNANTYEEKRFSEIGGMSRFQNSIMDEWETFEFTYNLSNEHNNRGEIYGVPYGGAFDDEFNSGSVEIMLNHNADGGLPNPNSGEIYFKVPGYQDDDTALTDSEGNPIFYMLSPHQVDENQNPIRVSVQHGPRNTNDYMVVASDLGDSDGGGGNLKTGLLDDGTFLEAYLMYVGGNSFGNQLPMNDGIDYIAFPDIVVAYWDGERWSYDNNQGYSTSRTFTPDDMCFIIARLYRSPIEESDGISGMDQYISNESQYSTGGLGNLSLFIQSGNNFQGRVLIDDIECFESYEFIPDVDVRKKLSVGNYANAELTNYYDKKLSPEEYKNTQAPLEAQFYFYPQYPTEETFVERLPIYNDFKKGKFYVYDINWGDGSPNEFTSEPEQIGESVALYHTYETSGIFEVTGTMIRVKLDKDDEIVGIAHNKKFKLRINVNPGLDEDFKYFGSDGFSFIPFEETVPIIGGISEQSNYYKTLKRQLGFLDNEKINIEFKNKSDKLKTEIALVKMENQVDGDLEVLPDYMIQREDENGDFIYNGISTIREELGKGIGDCDLSTIKYYNEPKSIWELFGFEEEDLEQVGNPDEPRYWKNIIPKHYDISTRNGLTNELTVRIGGRQDGENGTPPHYNIIINGVKYYDGFVEDSVTDGAPSGGQYDSIDFNIPIDRSLDIQEIRINYDNNGTPSIIEGDRNLYVSYIRINGVTFDGRTTADVSTHNDINVYYDSVGWYNWIENNPNQTSYNENGINAGGSMAWNGDMVFEIPTKYFKTTIDFSSEQEWINDYYYPVLPKFRADGTFSNTEITNQNIKFPILGEITNESEKNENLLINLVNEKIEVDVINDNSGNKSYGFFIQDFKPEFDEKTLRVKKNKKRSKVNSSKVNGAF